MIKRVILGTVLILHGLIHLLGVTAYWRLAEVEGLSYGTRLLSGSLEGARPAPGSLACSGCWGRGFVVAGAAILLLRPLWPPLTFGVAVLSPAITVLGRPDALFGVLVNLAILAYLLVGECRDWLPSARWSSLR